MYEPWATHLLLYLFILVNNTTVWLIVYSCYVTVSALMRTNTTFGFNVLVHAEINIRPN